MLVIMYVCAIVAANLLVALFGPPVVVINAFVFIGLDLTTRDALHEQWRGNHLRRNMALLIGVGSLISALLNTAALNVAVASFAAFVCSGVADTVVYEWLNERPRLMRVNGSNIASAFVDSLVFPAIAFGFPLMWSIVVGQFVAKSIGGFLWSLLLGAFVQKELA